LEYLLVRFFDCRHSTASPHWKRNYPQGLVSGFCPWGRPISAESGFAVLKMHGSIGFVIGGERNDGSDPLNLEPFFDDDDEAILKPFEFTLGGPGPVVFPWELFKHDGTFKPEHECTWSFPTKWHTPGKESFYHLLSETWKRARAEIQMASKISFVGISLHPYLRPGWKYLFEGKTGPLTTVIANPDMNSYSHRTQRGDLVLHRSCSAIRIRNSLSEICKIEFNPSDVSASVHPGFSEFMDHEMAPLGRE
jgi:hypothetical protein